MVPVSTRGEGERSAGGNRVTFCFLRLPLTLADPLERLGRVQEDMRELKGSGQIAGSELLMRSLEQLPGPLKTRAARFAASPRLYNLTVSNVPGPAVPLYVAGAEVTSVFPVIPLSDGHALALGVVSYKGAMHFAAHADPVTLPEARELPTLLSVALAELLEACDLGVAADSVRRARPRAPRRRRREPVALA
jgi:hypothetical protein